MTISRNVEKQLLTNRKRRRRSGGVPYPLKYTSALRDLDIWDHMFLVSCCQNLTMHRFTEPPPMVLDLGCGSGYWAMEVAKIWKESTIVGFDMRKSQPSPSFLGLPNLHWVHGNLLDTLPFNSNCFDFVRIVGIGLGVPEDEWQFVLEEVCRVMKPGGVLEVIEEDLIFPCGPIPDPATELMQCYSPSSPYAVLSEGWSSRQFLDKTSEEKSPTARSFHIPWPKAADTLKTSQSGETTTCTTSSFSRHDYHLQDHSKLKKAWDAMLCDRFLTTQLTAVLSFYLASTFEDVHTHAPLKIPLPPNSQSRTTTEGSNYSDDVWPDEFEPDVQFRLKSYSRKLSIETRRDVSSARSANGSHRRVPLWSSTHLAKTVQTVIACKESIWIEYENLFRHTLLPVRPGRTVSKISKESSSSESSLREEFEWAWSNWENDMMDRIGMRGRMAEECSWHRHQTTDELPSWKVWRNNLDIQRNAQPRRSSSPEPPELCRSLRCFIGWKASYHV